MAAAAIGMLLRTGISSAKATTKGLVPLIVMVATFIAVGVFRLPLIPVVCLMAPVSVALAWFASRPSTEGRP